MVIVLREVARKVVVAMAVEVDDAFADTSVRHSAGLSNRIDPPYTLRRASRSQNQPPVSSQPSVRSGLQAPKLRFKRANRIEPISQIPMNRLIWNLPARRQSDDNFSEINPAWIL